MYRAAVGLVIMTLRPSFCRLGLSNALCNYRLPENVGYKRWFRWRDRASLGIPDEEQA